MYPGGAPTSITGSHGNGANCTQCQGGTATTTAGLITSIVPAAGYVAGQTYLITATNNIAGAGKYGFEVSPQNAAGVQLGNLVAGTGSVLLSGGTKYITQSNARSSTKTWAFSWIAPAAGTGDVTFYGAMARNFPGVVTLRSMVVKEALTTTGLPDDKSSINVLPDGANGLIKVVLNTNASRVKISVIDLSGRQLLNTSVSGEGSYQLDQPFETGVYIVLVQAGNSVFKKKIMVIG